MHLDYYLNNGERKRDSQRERFLVNNYGSRFFFFSSVYALFKQLMERDRDITESKKRRVCIFF